MTACLFHDARVLTMDPARPHAEAVLERDGVIAAVGDLAAVSAHAADAERVDCGGGLLVPGFVDAHCHLLAAAAAARSIDCSPAAVRSIRDIQTRLREAAGRAPAGAWLRGAGYDESQLDECRHPTRRDLDEAVSHLPVRLLHRSRHAVVLNTRAMRLAGITITTPEPPGGYIERFRESGEPTGLLLEMNDVVDRVVPPLPHGELAAAVEEVSRRFLASGVTAICDATHTNGVREWELFARLQAEGRLPLRVALMEGIEHLGKMPSQSLGGVRRGHVKIMLSELGGALHPDEDELARMVKEVHARGRDAAIHAVEERAVAAAIDAIEAAQLAHPRSDHRHRIEHAALLPPGASERIARLGVTVVTQPSFVYHHGDRYLRDVPREKHDRLYPIGGLRRAGVRVAASSDAPVAPVDAIAGIRAAIDRRTVSGATLGAVQAVSIEQALAMWTREAAHATGEASSGVLVSGSPAALVLLHYAKARVEMRATFVSGHRFVPDGEGNVG